MTKLAKKKMNLFLVAFFCAVDAKAIYAAKVFDAPDGIDPRLFPSFDGPMMRYKWYLIEL